MNIRRREFLQAAAATLFVGGCNRSNPLTDKLKETEGYLYYWVMDRAFYIPYILSDLVNPDRAGLTKKEEDRKRVLEYTQRLKDTFWYINNYSTLARVKPNKEDIDKFHEMLCIACEGEKIIGEFIKGDIKQLEQIPLWHDGLLYHLLDYQQALEASKQNCTVYLDNLKKFKDYNPRYGFDLLKTEELEKELSLANSFIPTRNEIVNLGRLRQQMRGQNLQLI